MGPAIEHARRDEKADARLDAAGPSRPAPDAFNLERRPSSHRKVVAHDRDAYERWQKPPNDLNFGGASGKFDDKSRHYFKRGCGH